MICNRLSVEEPILDRRENPEDREPEEREKLVLSSYERDVILDSIEKSIEKIVQILRRNDPRNNTFLSNSINFVPTDVRWIIFINGITVYTNHINCISLTHP